jgi:hypothetical protein
MILSKYEKVLTPIPKDTNSVKRKIPQLKMWRHCRGVKFNAPTMPPQGKPSPVYEDGLSSDITWYIKGELDRCSADLIRFAK